MSIQWRGTDRRDGHVTIGIGLEAGNIEKLMNGKPFLLRGARVGLDHDIMIHYGASRETMITELRASGVDETLIAEAENAFDRNEVARRNVG